MVAFMVELIAKEPKCEEKPRIYISGSSLALKAAFNDSTLARLEPSGCESWPSRDLGFHVLYIAITVLYTDIRSRFKQQIAENWLTRLEDTRAISWWNFDAKETEASRINPTSLHLLRIRKDHLCRPESIRSVYATNGSWDSTNHIVSLLASGIPSAKFGSRSRASDMLEWVLVLLEGAMASYSSRRQGSERNGIPLTL